MNKKRIGLIVNPVAGIGGRAGLKGSDGPEIQAKARAMGVIAQSGTRTGVALSLLHQEKAQFELLVAPGEMGEDAALCAGFSPIVVGKIVSGKTTAADTVSIAKRMEEMGVDILAFSGGDGTARNLYEAVGLRVPTIGIPSGVKIHSAVYAINPQSAGKVLLDFVQGKPISLCEGEVMDIDEDAFRQGRVQAQLYGYLRVPASRRLMQSAKSGGYSEKEALAGMAHEVVSRMIPEDVYIIGSGTTPRGIMETLGQPDTLLGVDVLQNGRLIAADVNEQELYTILQTKHAAHMVLTVIGGQGHIFGRGNQQLSPRIIRLVGKEHIQIVASKSKLIALRGAPLLIDTGDPLLDEELCGYYRIITGYEDYMPYPAET